MFRIPPLDHVEEGSVSTKCPTCKVPTEQYFKVITPFNTEDTDPLSALKLSKRLVICSQCGNMRLIN